VTEVESRDPYLQALGIQEYAPRKKDSNGVDSAPGGSSVLTPDWEALQREVSVCTRCSLHETRTQTVFGIGNPDADWLFIGEAPGEQEDLRGEPFVGRAGQLLDEMI
jgi:DNA polymerase